jgi:orotidine-5'-phosphate decarboxylase
VSGSRSRAGRSRSSPPAPGSSPPSRGASSAPKPSFADRLAAAVEARGSQVCLGLDPDPAKASAGHGQAGGDPAARAAAAVAGECRALIERAGPACVAAKPQLACFERLGAPGWEALAATVTAAQEAGLVVIADGKRGDVPVSAAAYGQALVGSTPTPFGEVEGLGADAFTANPLLGGDALDTLVDAAAEAGAGVFALVRTSNAGAADVLDLPAPEHPLHERLAGIVAERAERLAGSAEGEGLSGMGAVAGATEPGFLARLRELMPTAVFLLPGVGAQGGDPGALGAAFSDHPASALVSASRSIASAVDPRDAAERLRETVASVAPGG